MFIINKLSRLWARTTIILIGLGVIFLFIASESSINIFIYLGALCLFVALYIKFAILKCPNCGWGGAYPQWSQSGTIHCPKCGKAIEYDK